MTLVLGVDLGTQSTKVVVCDADSGEVLRSGSAPHPDATEVEPGVWWDAFTAAGGGLLDDGSAENIAAMGVAGQQHGMVCLDDGGAVVRDALLWNDLRSASDATYALAVSAAFTFLFFCYSATRQRVEANWPAPAYIAAIPLLAALSSSRRASSTISFTAWLNTSALSPSIRAASSNMPPFGLPFSYVETAVCA